MASFAEIMNELLERNPCIYEPFKVLGVLSVFTVEDIYALLRYELGKNPRDEWIYYFLPENDGIATHRIEEMLDVLFKNDLVRRDFPSDRPLSTKEHIFVMPEVRRWVRELPISDLVNLAGRAIGTVACLVGNCDAQYLYRHMKNTWLYAGLAPSSRDNIDFWALYDWFEVFYLQQDFELVDSISIFIWERYNKRKPEENEEREDFSSSGKLFRVLEIRGVYLWRREDYESAEFMFEQALEEAETNFDPDDPAIRSCDQLLNDVRAIIDQGF